MEDLFEKVYLISGLFMTLLALIELFGGYDSLAHVYIYMCIGLFVFFDSLNYFTEYADSLISGQVTALNAALFIIMTGVVVGFFVELYGAFLTDTWPGVISTLELTDADFTFHIYSAVLFYGILALPSYSLFKILDNVYSAESMLKDDFESDFFRYFIHAGLLMLVIPFVSLIIDLSPASSFLMFLVSMTGLFMIIEYYNFRKKGGGLILRIWSGDYKNSSIIIGISILIGTVVSIYLYGLDIWSTSVPFEGVTVLGVPIVLSLMWSVLSLVGISALNLITETEFKLE